MAAAAAGAHAHPSLRRRLLAFLLIPTVLLMLVVSALFYLLMLKYANHVHDMDLKEDTLGLAKAVNDAGASLPLPLQARRLLEYSSDGRVFFEVRSRDHGVISNSAQPIPAHAAPAMLGRVLLRDERMADGTPVRVASLIVPSAWEANDRLTISVAETLDDRHRRAREILMLMLPTELLLTCSLLALVWHGVRVGLRLLQPAVRRLDDSQRDLSPVSGPDIPIEVLPLTQAIDGLLGRLKQLMALQERFVADAAHQLRTPLAGLSMHVQRAQASTRAQDTAQALQHIRQLTDRAIRSSTQLLALTRAQAPRENIRPLLPLDLAAWLPQALAERIPDALQAGVDLGYDDDEDGPAWIAADAWSLRELLDNLLDNAFKHAAGSMVTVSLRRLPQHLRLAIDDAGAGLDEALLPRLGERFFRAPDAPEGGTGLGLAIVASIAARHHATLRYQRSALGGLRVELDLPASAAPPA
ncbi:sensor histidine kinase [Xanthomonas hyacinthi]|uniref:histidine kinase n=1 Tax=Xanthomonas hyacinthi TaxID=56455 RepID=A0A2S7ESI9_9XANT|nr:histidine kinase [Xanthomonas hyacinthi DSM 19077]PPU96087.1 histidine kinase [Xanthomonas hyacinthi]QGY75428.1 sensor histidine kinase [Xanthomonas hyacinthi]